MHPRDLSATLHRGRRTFILKGTVGSEERGVGSSVNPGTEAGRREGGVCVRRCAGEGIQSQKSVSGLMEGPAL